MLVVGDGSRVIANVVMDLGAECVYGTFRDGARAKATGQDVDSESVRLESLMEVTQHACKGDFRRVERPQIGVGELSEGFEDFDGCSRLCVRGRGLGLK